MLAAVAAAFDKFPVQAGRLAALDEVPSVQLRPSFSAV